MEGFLTFISLIAIGYCLIQAYLWFRKINSRRFAQKGLIISVLRDITTLKSKENNMAYPTQGNEMNIFRAIDYAIHITLNTEYTDSGRAFLRWNRHSFKKVAKIILDSYNTEEGKLEIDEKIKKQYQFWERYYEKKELQTMKLKVNKQEFGNFIDKSFHSTPEIDQTSFYKKLCEHLQEDGHKVNHAYAELTNEHYGLVHSDGITVSKSWSTQTSVSEAEAVLKNLKFQLALIREVNIPVVLKQRVSIDLL